VKPSLFPASLRGLPGLAILVLILALVLAR
jgi:hypothetical protein